MSRDEASGSASDARVAAPSGSAVTALDDVVQGLRALREEHGLPSYSDLVVRIAENRLARGVPAAAARPARSTVYDAFRTGRSRIRPELVADIVLALTDDAALAAEWQQRCQAARALAERTDQRDSLVGEAPSGIVPASGHAAERAASGRRRVAVTAATVVASVLVNLVGTAATSWLRFPLYNDMIGTAIAACTLGPWWGALVGVATNLSAVAVNGPSSLPFVLVQLVGALAWGYGLRSLRPRTLPSYLGFNVLVGAVCSFVAVPILIVVYGGLLRGSADAVALSLAGLGVPIQLAVLASNLLISVADKVIAGVIALVVAGTVLAGRSPGWLVALTSPRSPHAQDFPSMSAGDPAELRP